MIEASQVLIVDDEVSARDTLEALLFRAGREIWQGMQQMLLEYGPLDEPLDVQELYTMVFLQSIYGDEQ